MGPLFKSASSCVSVVMKLNENLKERSSHNKVPRRSVKT